MTLEKIKFDYHVSMQKAYMPMLRDKNKERHPKIYAFADKHWRNHGLKALNELKTIIEEKRRSL